MAVRFDAIVIGSGQSGPSLAVRLANAGRRTAIIERHRFGGTCVNAGCIPTKTLIASARVAHLARHASEFGVMIDAAVLDVMYTDAPYTVLQRAMHIHPTVAEFIPTLLGNLQPLPDE